MMGRLDAARIKPCPSYCNNDGKPDLSVLEDCGRAKCTEPGSVEVLLGQGGGSFSNFAIYPVGDSPVSLAVGDLNNDKRPDIVVANSCWMRYLGMMLLAVAAMHGIGCSIGGFTRASSTVGVVGSYVIQIESTQNGNTTTVAVVPLLIEQ